MALTLAIAALLACGGAHEPEETTRGAGGSGGTGGQGGSDVPRPDPTMSRASASMAEGRSHHTATLLSDGRVVVLGGQNAAGEPLASVEIFDPQSESWSGLPPLPEPRANHTATLLDSGVILVAGGGRSNQNGSPSPDGVLDSAVLYDPGGVGVLQEILLDGPRSGHHALRLSDGDVLVMGGGNDEIGSACTTVPDCYYAKALASAERFDTDTQTFSLTGSMVVPRILFGALLLDDGTPLIVGGASDTVSLARVELFDSQQGIFGELAPLTYARFRPVVVTLGSGQVLAAAGKVANVGPVGVTEIYDPISNVWMAGPDIGAPRTGSAAVALDSGNALVVGGYDQTTNAVLDELLIFDATGLSWQTLPPLQEPRTAPTATLLLDGRVLIVGGVGGLASCEIAE